MCVLRIGNPAVGWLSNYGVDRHYCLFGLNKSDFFNFHVSIGMFSKNVTESSLLPKDESLTPNIGKVEPI